MKVVKITGVRDCEIVERPQPTVKDNYCVVKIIAAPMCTEFHGYRDGHISAAMILTTQ